MDFEEYSKIIFLISQWKPCYSSLKMSYWNTYNEGSQHGFMKRYGKLSMFILLIWSTAWSATSDHPELLYSREFMNKDIVNHHLSHEMVNNALAIRQCWDFLSARLYENSKSCWCHHRVAAFKEFEVCAACAVSKHLSK